MDVKLIYTSGKTCVSKDGKIVAIMWYDKFVTLANVFLSNNATDVVKRWSKNDSIYIDVNVS